MEERTGKIEIYKCAESYCGKIIWREDARKDIKNPGKNLQSRSVIGLSFLQNFVYDKSRNQWIEGTVYSIDNGSTYSGKLWLEEDGKVLKMRGYIGISLFGRTATLERVE